MKFIKFSFAAVIAIAALGITIASHAGAFSSAVADAARVTGCFRQVTILSTPPTTFTDATTISSNPGSIQCSQDPSLQIDGRLITSLENVSTTNPPVGGVVAADDCLFPDPAFCCYQVVNDEIVGICYGEFQQ